MKIRLSVSKRLLLLISGGMLLVAVAGLGTSYVGQMQEQAQLSDDLELAQNKLAASPLEKSFAHLSDLTKQSQALDAEIVSSKKQLSQSIVGTDVLEILQQAAGAASVDITAITSTGRVNSDIGKVPVYALPVNISVKGEVPSIYSFVVKLSERFPTETVRSIDVTMPDKESMSPTASIKLNIYSYRGG